LAWELKKRRKRGRKRRRKEGEMCLPSHGGLGPEFFASRF
jgi:hypothetical protein